MPGMNSRQLMLLSGVLTVVFLALNFTMEAGTIFLILAVVTGVATVLLATRPTSQR